MACGAAHAETEGKRVALVVGNASYQNAPKLRNPTRDADAMARSLRATGFEVIEVKDATKQKLERAIVEFGTRLAKGGVGLFFYSGHGMQVNGKNYLIPVDAELAAEGAVKVETTDVDLVLDQMTLAETGFNMVILDACRNNPFERKFRSVGGGGLAAVDDAPKGTLIAYSTAPGKVAMDGEGANGVYTTELLKAMQTPGLTAEDVFKRVRVAVTGDAQTPWEESSLTGEFYFVAPQPAMAAPPPLPQPAANTGQDAEIAFWNSVKDDKNAEAFRAYLAKYPNGQFIELANLKIEEIEAAAQQVAMATPPALAQAPSSLAQAPSSLAPATKACPAPGTEIRESDGSSFRIEKVDGLSCCGTATLNGPGQPLCAYGGVLIHGVSIFRSEEYFSKAKDEVAKLWPLQVGKKVAFDWVSTGGHFALLYSERYEVTRTDTITVPAGTFQVFEVTHERKNRTQRLEAGVNNRAEDGIEHFYLDPASGVAVKYEYLAVLSAASDANHSWEAVSITNP